MQTDSNQPKDLTMQRPSEPSKDLSTFPNPSPDNDYTIRITVPEFTCLCPLTGQPDFANFVIEYVPEAECVELKSLKMYFWSFREEGGFHEKLTNEVLAKLVEVTNPRFMRVTANWNVRGGIFTTVVVEHKADNWIPSPRVELP
jgi:7-cyano-7-deazaguanine reductase